MGRKSRRAPRAPKQNGEGQKPYVTAEKDNALFKEYYKRQNLLSEEEFDEFYNILKTSLPTTFRITGTRSNKTQLREIIETMFVPNMQAIEVDGQVFEPPKPLPWYPDHLGWQVNVPRTLLRKSTEFSNFQKFIVAETEAGNMNRQEAVSMVPPLLMDIQPHHWVLDMCAAPGSKTAQIIEAVHSNDMSNELPRGLVVANDADYRRSHMLVHQIKRLQSPCFMATNHKAQQLPTVHLTDDKGDKMGWQFDRVLCDVPCSGDGTMRKNEGIWGDWRPSNGLGLHRTQVQIFLRGAQLTKVGGRIVYSTCSFNPVENEAVVAEVLRLTDGALELQDVSDKLEGLKRKPGLSTWKVMAKDGQFVDSPADAAATGLPPSVFPPENAADLHLERCLRIYPHLQNTGGFFVAVFDKVKPLTAADKAALAKSSGQVLDEKEVEAAEAKEETLVESILEEDVEESPAIPSKRSATPENEEEEAERKATNKRQRKDVQQRQEAPFELLGPDSSDVVELCKSFDISSEFPRDQYILRSEEVAKNRNVYFCSKPVKMVLESPDKDRLHIVNSGLRIFSRQGSLVDGFETPFRLTADGLPLLEKYITSDRRTIDIPDVDLRVLLMEHIPKNTLFSEETQKKLQETEALGGCIFKADINKAFDKPLKTTLKMSLPVWRGKSSVNLLINKQDKKFLCQRVYGITPKPTTGTE
ncbi:S-adenosyl-L-methionine-dependent methyltransferase [Dichotomocladium elegans]|nr:S-adenosyl-L-methionine-dependent methyltransferase [Dichotomocladium elegans]